MMIRMVLQGVVFAWLVFLSVLSAFGAYDSSQVNRSHDPLTILSVNPSGEDVPASRQITFRFNRPVVPVGRMERNPSEIPISIVPTVACEWRWLNTSTLACQLGEKTAMLPATRYTINVHPGIRTEDGSTIAQTYTYSFITERPQVTEDQFKTWNGPGSPVIRIYFNQPVTAGSVSSHIYMQTGDGKRYPVTAIEDPDYVQRGDAVHGRVWLVSPQEQLPLNSSVSLRVEKGIEPLQGKEPGVEGREVVAFDTFPEFSFLGVQCQNNDGNSVTIKPGQKVSASEFCDPLAPVSLMFSAPVLPTDVKEGLKVVPALSVADTDSDSDQSGESDSYSHLSSPHEKGTAYHVAFPEILRAYQPYTVQGDGGRIRDEFGRALSRNFRVMFFTDHRKPQFSFDHRYSVLETGIDSELPLVVTNLKSVKLTYDTLTVAGKVSGQRTLPVAKVQDIAYHLPLQVRKAIPGSSGLAAGTFETDPPVRSDVSDDRFFFTQVTPFCVQAKVGHFTTVVWVTDFATGQPVPGMVVDIYRDRFPGLSASPSVVATVKTDKNGIALLPGTQEFDPELAILHSYGEKGDKFFIRCRKGNDLAILPLMSAFEAGSYDEDGYVYSSLQRKYGHIHSWGTTAQGVYKAGDTVQFKLFVRNQDNRIFVQPPLKGYSLQVIDPMDTVVYEVKHLTLSEFGSYAGEFAVPKNGAVGWYRFVLSASFNRGSWTPMRVLISDFTPAPFRVTTDLNGDLFRIGEQIKVSTQARLHAGGPYANAQTRIAAVLQPLPFESNHPAAQGFYFGSEVADSFTSSSVFETQTQVNEKGDLEKQFAVNEAQVLYGRLTVESAVRDDRGKYVAGSASARYVGRDRFVGILQPDWLLQVGRIATVKAIVVDEQGNPVSGTPVTVTIEHQKAVASRVKGAGNAYITHFEYEWEKVAELRLTSAAGAVEGTFAPDLPGEYRFTARVEDTKGRPHSSTIGRWAVGKGIVLWGSEPGLSLQIIPEKKEYRVGEKARYLVKNPFPGAKALITIERYGTIKSWVETFADNTPVVEFEVEPDFVPGFYLSVSVMSPRVAKPVDENQVDLGKPSFRMGYVEVPVKDPYKELVVEVKPEKQVYRPRDTVNVEIKAHMRQANQSEIQPPMELAVAVVDEAVFDLIQGGKNYYDVYRGFYYLDPLDVRNYNLLMQLIGRQKFEKKGANAGGDGGPDLSMRSLFKFVSYWNAAIKTGGDGTAKISFPVPDNLTGWRVLVMAVTTKDRIGLGDASFSVNRPTEIRPALPNQVTVGDTFLAGFTVMNRTNTERTLDVTLGADGAAETPAGMAVGVITQKITAPPYKRSTVWLPIKAAREGEITFTVKAWDATDGDAIQQKLTVRKRASLETAATYGTTTAKEVTERIAFPAKIRTDIGAVSVVASPTVIGNVAGAFAYMRDYPYICWEQQLTKGVMASHYQNLKGYLPPAFEWPGSKWIPKETLRLAGEHQASNGGMCYYIPDDLHVSPYLSAYTAIAFNWLKKAGYKIPEQTEKKLQIYLLDLLRHDAFPSFYSKGMASTVRAVALAALAPSGKITKADLERYRPFVQQMSLFGKAHYLQALLQVPGTQTMRHDVATMILAHANETGGKFIFSEPLDAGYAQLLTSTTRDNGAVLSALLAYSETPEGAKVVADVPYKLVRTITQMRGQKDRWENTQDNMFCMNALIEYARVYEKDKPDFVVHALLDGEKIGDARFSSFTDKATEVSRPIKSSDPGHTATLKIERDGKGRMYYAARLAYAPAELKMKPINSGIEVHREYSVERSGKWILLKSPMQIKRGELVRVDIYLSLPAARNFVVVDDQVPGGLEPVNRDLATASAVDAAKGDYKPAGGSFWFRCKDWMEYGISFWSFYHKELRHDAARFYSEYLPAGNYHLSYTAQAVAPGEFTVLPLNAEEMYDPDVFGKSEPAVLKVEKGE